MFGDVVILQQHVLTKFKKPVQYVSSVEKSTTFFKKLSVILFPVSLVWPKALVFEISITGSNPVPLAKIYAPVAERPNAFVCKTKKS